MALAYSSYLRHTLQYVDFDRFFVCVSFKMPGYQTKVEQIYIKGVHKLTIRSLLDRQQYCDPDGAAESLGISSAIWPLFGLIWPSGAQLAAQIALRPVRHTEKILEIGCGLALATLVAHRRGAHITASDCHPLAASFLNENARLNGLSELNYKHGQWGDARPVPDALALVCLSGQYDLIIGSDLLYERDTPALLAAFIDRHAAPQSEVWIVDPDRGHRPAFNRKMAARGFALKRDKRMPREIRITPDGLQPYKGRMLVYERGEP